MKRQDSLLYITSISAKIFVLKTVFFFSRELKNQDYREGRNLGFVFDSHMSMEPNISAVIQRGYNQL